MPNLPPITPEMLAQMGATRPIGPGRSMPPMGPGSPMPPNMMRPGLPVPRAMMPVSQMMQAALPGVIPRTDPYLQIALRIMKMAEENPDSIRKFRTERDIPRNEARKVYGKVVELTEEKFKENAPKPSISGVMEKIHGKKNTNTTSYPSESSGGVTGTDVELPVG